MIKIDIKRYEKLPIKHYCLSDWACLYVPITKSDRTWLSKYGMVDRKWWKTFKQFSKKLIVFIMFLECICDKQYTIIGKVSNENTKH